MKQKMDREVRVKVQQDLFEKFQEKCEAEFKTISIVIRELMKNYAEKK